MKYERNVAVQTYNLEKEIHEDCLSCGKNITHPLCPNCIAKAFVQWLAKFPEEKEIRKKLNAFMRQHNKIEGRAKRCVSCGEHKTHLCPYCFTKYLHKLVKEAGLGVRATSEFLFMFNFDFKHKGYYRELEAYGGY